MTNKQQTVHSNAFHLLHFWMKVGPGLPRGAGWPTWAGRSWRRSTRRCTTGRALDDRCDFKQTDANWRCHITFINLRIIGQDGDWWRGWHHHEDRGGAHQGRGGGQRQQPLGEPGTHSRSLQSLKTANISRRLTTSWNHYYMNQAWFM